MKYFVLDYKDSADLHIGCIFSLKHKRKQTHTGYSLTLKRDPVDLHYIFEWLLVTF